MLYLVAGIAILGGLLLLGYLFINADPARLARTVKWTGIAVAAAALLALLVLTEGRVLFLAAPAAGAAAALAAAAPEVRRHARPGRQPQLDGRDPVLRMSLDHDTGTMTGTVLQGRFAGMRLEELRPPSSWRCCANAAPPTRRAPA